jgi:endonuclease/exonuclease/phosphatase family metal-dependent hydrolase
MTFEHLPSEQPDGSTEPTSPVGDTTRRLRLLSYNIQTGVATRRYRQYLTQSWKHVLPHPERFDNLDRIATLLEGYDIVGLQEVDGGSLRSGFVNQTEYLALAARYPYWRDQTNRDFGKLARHSLGVLSRLRPSSVKELRLPGIIPGRGTLWLRFGHGEHALHVLILHLALGRRARLQQFAHIAEHISGCRHVVIMGDFNCPSESLEMNWLLERTGLREPVHGLHTFPSWRPARNIDHILVSPTLEVRGIRVLNQPISDHLPIEMEIGLPDEVRLGVPRLLDDTGYAPSRAAAY